ncbi:MAG: amino acid adenylation domain-containing protein, partial [Bacilli bacterium]|nr:amino acid adenylation domain-containing protein [Bacilli bacterium]
KQIKDINTLPEEDKKLYAITNDTDVEIPNDVTVNKIFEKQVELHKDKVAVIDVCSQFTYQELNALANKVAHTLIDNGVTKNQTVVMLMPRLKEAYAVRQGIVKSGGAFLPIDPKYPDERVGYIIGNSQTQYVITTKKVLEEKEQLLKDAKVKVFLIEDIAKSNKADNPNVKISQKDLAYVIYTSGSTGKPKGVMISHRNILNYVLDGNNLTTAEYRYIGEECVSCSFASLSFDASLQEEFVPLTHGYTVVIASEEEIENQLLLAQTLKKHGVNIMFMTPSFVSNLLDIPQFVEALRNFKVLDMGAEAVPIELCQKLRGLGVNAQINNGYGPTETTITSTYSTVKDEYMTIGRPVGNTKAYILDKAGHILPINAIGDLTLAGESVGMGYLGNEEKTKQVFIELNGLRAYRTGDLARINGDGNIEFFGRLDNQVKLRGLRVELDEIEKVINTYPGMSTSIVIVKNAPEGDYLVAYFVASKEIDKDDLTAHISKSLTPYMIPKAMMQLDKLPLTANGKVDKKNLPAIQVNETKKEIKEASNELEKKLVALFQKALANPNVGVDDDFFELGGTSLSVSKIAMLALNENLPIAYGDVFEYPTVLQLEEHINSLQGNAKKQDEKKEEYEFASLKHNVVEEVDDIKIDFEYKKVLLAGATGFLGIHLLYELIQQKNHVVALVRGGSLSAKDRLLAMLTYYFDSPFEEEIEQYVEVVDADVTNNDLYEKLKDYDFNIIINSAAIVKHFANDDIIERVNVGGVKNLIEIAKAKKARIIQISTLSVAGENIDNKFPSSFKIKENMLDFGQDVSNKYVHSK